MDRFSPAYSHVPLPSAVGGACWGDRERSGAEGLWQDGRGHPPHRLLQERGLRTWVCSWRMTCFWDWCVFFSLTVTPVDALKWAVGDPCLHTPHQESSLTPSSPWIYRSIFTPAARTQLPLSRTSTRTAQACRRRKQFSLWLQPHPVWQTVGALSPRSKFNNFHSFDVQKSCIHQPKKAQADVWLAQENTRVQTRQQQNTTVVFQVLPPSGASKIELNDGLFKMYLCHVLPDRLRQLNPFWKSNRLMSYNKLLFFLFLFFYNQTTRRSKRLRNSSSPTSSSLPLLRSL